MEFNIGKKKISVSKKHVVRGVVTFTAGAGAYIIVRKVVKAQVPPETLNVFGKVVVGVGAFFMANAVADKVSESAGKFFDECVDSYQKMNEAVKETNEEIKKAFEETNKAAESV